MMIKLEIVPASIGDNATIKNVKLSYAPRIETGFSKTVLQKIRLSHLQVSNPSTNTANSQTRMYASHIVVMAQPTHRAGLTINVGKLHEFYLIDLHTIWTAGHPH